MISIIEEIVQGDFGRSVYVAKHPFLNFGVDLASTAAGAYGGYKYAQANGLDPRVGFSLGLVNGSNIGQLGGELIDRGLRNAENSPYKGKRTVGDAARDFLIGSAVGNATAHTMASHGLPFAGLGGYVAGELGKGAYYGLTEPSNEKKKKK